MNNTEARIKKYLNQLNGKSADYVTSAFKKYGGSDESTMVDGVTKMIEELIVDKNLCITNAKVKYGVGCFAIGTVMTAALGGVMWLCSKRETKKLHQLKQEELAEILEKEVARAMQDELLGNDTEECVPSDSDECEM